MRSGVKAICKLIVELDAIVLIGAKSLLVAVKAVDVGNIAIDKILHIKDVRKVSVYVVVIGGCSKCVAVSSM